MQKQSSALSSFRILCRLSEWAERVTLQAVVVIHKIEGCEQQDIIQCVLCLCTLLFQLAKYAVTKDETGGGGREGEVTCHDHLGDS